MLMKLHPLQNSWSSVEMAAPRLKNQQRWSLSTPNSFTSSNDIVTIHSFFFIDSDLDKAGTLEILQESYATSETTGLLAKQNEQLVNPATTTISYPVQPVTLKKTNPTMILLRRQALVGNCRLVSFAAIID